MFYAAQLTVDANKSKQQRYFAEQAHDMLAQLNWRNTPQGFNYWREVSRNLYWLSLPPQPEITRERLDSIEDQERV